MKSKWLICRLVRTELQASESNTLTVDYICEEYADVEKILEALPAEYRADLVVLHGRAA